MRKVARRLGIGLVVVVAAVAAVFGGLLLWANSEFTWCYARFDTVQQAEAALEEIREAEAGAGMETEPRGRRISVTFESGESGEDAQAFRRAVAPAVARQRGRLGHPGDGCLERTPFM